MILATPRVHMNVTRAFTAGVAGALAVSAGSGLLALGGVRFRLELLLGSLLLESLGPAAWFVGLGLLLLAGGAVGLVYAALFEKSFHASGIGLGLAIGAVHGVVSGIALAFAADVHPLVPALLPAPGPFFLAAGAFGVVLFLALHLIFGAVIAAWYGPVLEPRREPLGGRRRPSTR